MLSRDEIKKAFARSWNSKNAETPCGQGSLLESTVEIREALPLLIKKYRITKINDAGCGDFNWISQIDFNSLGVSYLGYDIVDRKHHKKAPLPYREIEICSELMRKADLIICRDVLVHLPNEYVMLALENFRKKGTYLLATSFKTVVNARRTPQIVGQFKKINMEGEPFRLGKPIEEISEPKLRRFVGLWKLR